MTISDSFHRLHTALGPERYEVVSETTSMGWTYALDAAKTLADDCHAEDGGWYTVFDNESPYGRNVAVYDVGAPEYVDVPDRFFDYEMPDGHHSGGVS